MELYKFLTGLIQHFEIVAAPGEKLPLEPAPGMALTPQPYNVFLKTRK